MKGGKELDAAKFPITHTDGVITIEIINSQPGDSGKYRCVATNDLGSDTTECVVIVEGEREERLFQVKKRCDKRLIFQDPT